MMTRPPNALRISLLILCTIVFFATSRAYASSAREGSLAEHAAARASAVSGNVLEVAPLVHNFGVVNAGQIETRTFTVTNNSAVEIHISAVTPTAGTLRANPGMVFPMTVAPSGGTASILVDFAPVDGSSSSTALTIQNDGDNPSLAVFALGRGNTPPVFQPPLASEYSLTAFVPFALSTPAVDPEGDDVSRSIASVPPLPVGATFDGFTGEFAWTPLGADAGDYAVTITASDGHADTPANFTLHVAVTNRPPVANPGGPYDGLTALPVTFDGTASSDPDGQPLSYFWDLGDGATSTSPTPAHAYEFKGVYLITLTVTDNGTPPLSSTTITTASIVDYIPITIVQPTGNLPIIKTNGNGLQKFGIECYVWPLTDINPRSIHITTTYPHAGTVSRVNVPFEKPLKVGDINDNLFGDLDFSVRSAVVRPLLSHVPNGARVTLVFHAFTVGDDSVPMYGTIDLTKSGPSSIAAAAAPNPLRRETVISYTVPERGSVTVRIFSVNGALVRTLRQELANPGAYETRWNGKDDAGRDAPSGIYFANVAHGATSSRTRLILIR